VRAAATVAVAVIACATACATEVEWSGADAADGQLATAAFALCPPIPCTPDNNVDECDDGLANTLDVCTDGFCKNVSFGGGCVPSEYGSGPSCDDSNPCSLDACKKADPCHVAPSCVNKVIKGCCTHNLDCNDGQPCTIDTCNLAALSCVQTPKKDCCDTSKQCLDGDPCTEGWCVNNTCYFPLLKNKTGCAPPPPPPCQTWMECVDDKVCTADYCHKGTCKHAKVEGCCEDDADALTACDDKNGCTIDYCLNNTCRYTAPKSGCCASDADCFDGDKSTLDKCENISPVTYIGTCKFTKNPAGGCSCSVDGAMKGMHCNDNNLCTTDMCVDCKCVHKAVPTCCNSVFECDDGHPCTWDACIFNTCTNLVLQADADCCSPKTEELDCWSYNLPGFQGQCLEQPDGKFKCAKVPKG